MIKRSFAAVMAVFLLLSVVNAQKAEVTVSLNEPFFDALLDSIFQNFDPPEFPIAKTEIKHRDAEARPRSEGNRQTDESSYQNVIFIKSSSASRPLAGKKPFCTESVKILREMNGVRSAVRFRDGKIIVPLAFSGNYELPFIGCINFAGWANTNIDVAFDQNSQKLIGRARVLEVNLNGSGGVGGTVIAKLIQSSIDRKLNPIEILSLDKMSFSVPIQNTGNLRMKAKSVRPEVGDGVLKIHIVYEFAKE